MCSFAHAVGDFMSLLHEENNHDDDGGGEENEAEGIGIEEDGRNAGKYQQTLYRQSVYSQSICQNLGFLKIIFSMICYTRPWN